jgi:hypothetical protein
MIYKRALTDNVPLDLISSDNRIQIGMVKTASGKIIIEPNSEKAKIVEAEISKHPNSLFFRSKSIEANCPNSNGDYFSEEELVRAHKTFEGVPFFTNHDNQNIENARGKVIFAEWVPEEKAVYTISFVDRDAYPHICRSIEEEYVTGVSMGCSVEYSVCNICGNKAERTDDYCTHIKNRKGRKFTGRARNVVTGETKDFRDEKVFEYNYGIKFIELSAVVDPACPSCHIQDIIDNENYLKKVASIENSLSMIRTAAIEKNASKEEIDQMEGVLKTLEEFSVNLIKNRKQVEMTFATELVEILSDLQTWLDELIGAGYANAESGNVPGTTDAPTAEAPTAEAPEVPAPAPALPPSNGNQVVGAVPAASSTPVNVGKVSGAPGKPSTSSPKLPITAPLKPRATDGRSIQRISDYHVENGKQAFLKAASLCEKMKKMGEPDMAKRRTINEKIGQREIAKEVLSNSWKEKHDFLEYINKVPSVQDNVNKLSVKKRDDSFVIVAESKVSEMDKMIWTYEDLTGEQKQMIKEFPKTAAVTLLETFSKSLTNTREGENRMTDIKQKAGATTVIGNPEVVTEKQLEQKGLYHSRVNQDVDQVTQAQLESLRKGEQDVVTEKQLNEGIKLNPRTGVEAEEVQEAQLEGLRENNERDQVTQAQLDGNRVNNEQDVITEKQLNNTPAPWARAAGSTTFKSAGEHIASAIKVMAKTAISTGCTPEEICEVCSSLVDTTKNRSDLATSIATASKNGEEVDFTKRLSFWNNKNLKIASAGKKEIAESIVDGLRKVASDKSINSEVLISAVDVIGEAGDAVTSIANSIDEQLKEAASSITKSANIKNELRQALSGSKAKREEERNQILASISNTSSDSELAKINRQAERNDWEKILNKKAVKNADTIIETSFNELGCVKADPSFRSSIKSFAKGALASQNIKLAAITNVTISGDTIQIAVQTDEGNESVEIPVGDSQAPLPEETVPEGDLSGEGMENTLGTAPAPAPAPATTASNKKMTKVAQSPMGGGVPGTPGGASASGAPEQGLPGGSPDGGAIQSLTNDPAAKGEEGIPTVGEQQMPWTICPECGTSDVDVTNEEGDIKGKCNNPECGAEYEAMVKKEIEFKITKPSKLMGGEGTAETPEAPEAEAEVPALPVAAQTRLDKGAIVRIGKNKEKHGNVCPSCGKTACKATKDESGHTEFTCPSCKTSVEKDVVISSKNPEVGFLRVQWDLKAKAKAGCKECDEKVSRFASKLKMEKLVRSASSNDSFPMANCLERVARTYGGNNVGTFGPCKDKPLAECVCKQLKRLALTKVKSLTKFAEVSLQKDPMDECLEDQTKKGYSKVEASGICGCLKKSVKAEIVDLSENAYAQAFAEEKTLTKSDLETLHKMDIEAKSTESIMKQAKMDDEEIGSDLPELKEASVEVEVVKESSSDEVVKEAKKELPFCTKCKKATAKCECSSDKKDKKEDKKDDKNDKKDEGDKEVEDDKDDKKEALAMNGQRIRKTNEEVLKMASTPKKIESIEGNVEAGVPRSEAYMGKEKEADSMINKTPAKPNVPRGNAYMGKEQEADSMINKELKLPDVAVDSSYMGKEKDIQSGMPAINNEIKGTVIANDEKVTKEAKKMKEVDSVEDDVEAGVPRGKATLGNEGKDNIDVDMAKPDVPRSDAYMGNEKDADSLINAKLEGPDVPLGDAYMGDEKEVQKGMPGTNEKMLKQVKQQREDQMGRIAHAREQKANRVASWLVANKRVGSDLETFENVVKALSVFEIDKITSVAEKMFPERSVKTASTENRVVEAGHSLPAIVLESKSQQSDDFTNKLSKAFTIGNTRFDQDLTIYGEKNK